MMTHAPVRLEVCGECVVGVVPVYYMGYDPIKEHGTCKNCGCEFTYHDEQIVGVVKPPKDVVVDGMTQLEYVDMYCELVSTHCNELMKGKANEDVEPIEKLALALSLLNSAVRSLKNAYEEGEETK